MRLIDADALLLIAMHEDAYGYVSAEEIVNAPTVEPKRGRWKKLRAVPQVGSLYKGECSECGAMTFVGRYCMECGANMEVEDE